MMANAVQSRVALGSSNTRCLLYSQVCLYATLEKFQIMFTQVYTFQLLRSALPDPLPQITSVSIALTPLIYHVQVHCMISIFLCSIYTKYKTEIFSWKVGPAKCQEISLQRKETHQFHQWGLFVTNWWYTSRCQEDWIQRLSCSEVVLWPSNAMYECFVQTKWIISVI